MLDKLDKLDKKGKIRSERNRTISLNDEELQYYLSKCISVNSVDKVVKTANFVNLDKNPILTNSIIHGDLFEVRLPQNFVDLLIVDPPYNISKIYGKEKFHEMDENEYRYFTENWLEVVKPTLKNTATVYVCCDWKSSLIIGDVLSYYFTVQNRITWQREKGRGAKRNWKNSMEDIWFATVSPKNFTFNVDSVKMRRKVIAPYKVDGNPKDWIANEMGNFRDTFPSNFWDDISVPYWSMPENTEHPTQKPEKLLAKLILASSNVGDVVLDPFLGSGTTAVVAKKLGRKYIGIEREEEYCAIAQKRLEMAETDKEIQGYTDGVFWERNSLALQQKYKNGQSDKSQQIKQIEMEE